MKIKNLIATTVLSTALMASASFAAEAAAPAQNSALSPGQVQQIEKVVHDYLLKNPQLMVQVFQELQKQQQVQMQQQAVKGIQDSADALFNDKNSPVVGNPSGAVTVVEFFDYQCPHCKAMTPILESLIKQDKNLKVILKEFPIFPGSDYAAQAALAANMQGKYWEFHNELMTKNNPLTKDDVLAAAKKVGLNVEQLQKDMDSEKVKNELQQTETLAEKLGLGGTPAFIIQSNTNKDKTFFVPGQIDEGSLQQFIQKAS